jgi:gamma-glutamyltranspeptidase/glutathione hydrolase
MFETFLPGNARQFLSLASLSTATRSIFCRRLSALVGCSVAVLLVPFAAHAQRDDRPAPELPSAATQKNALATAQQFMVSAAHPLATEAGVKILAEGGSAVDAAIAVQLVLGLVEPQSSGIGGGAFMLHFDAKARETLAYDGRESAPRAATPQLFLDDKGQALRFGEAVIGGRSVGVPGVLRLLEAAHKKHGKLKWARLFEPAIILAEQGFELAPRLHLHLSNDRVVKNDAVAREVFFNADGAPKALGTTLFNKAYADTLRAVAHGGAAAFHEGPIAEDIVKAVQSHPTNPGTLALEDLRDYRARVSKPLCGPYRDYTVCGMPPPSAGGIAILQILGALQRFDLPKVRPFSTEAVHLFSEAGRLAFADRERFVADDQFVKVPTAALISPAYIKRRGESIRAEKSMGVAQPGAPVAERVAFADGLAWDRDSTSHFSIVDTDGNALAMTTSVESVFGSRLWVRGFFLNNQLTDFSFVPEKDGMPVANAVAPNKRPRSSMAPTLVFDKNGDFKMAIGSALGTVIINFTAKTIIAALDWNLDMQAAIASPHFGSRNGPTELEVGTPVETLAASLKALGHDTRVGQLPSGLHGIMRTANGYQGGADPRRDGVAAGR